jgi:hypothetical protein
LLGVSMQEPGQPGTVPAGALDRPHPLPTVLVGQLEELPVAIRGGGRGQVGQGLAGGRGEGRGGVGLLVGVDADDDLDGVCQHGHRVVLLARRMTWSVPVRDEARQDCDGTRPL